MNVKMTCMIIYLCMDICAFDEIHARKGEQIGMKLHGAVKMPQGKHLNTVVQATKAGEAKHTGRNVSNERRWTTSEKCAGVQEAVWSTT